MFGVAADFRKAHGEAAFRVLASTAFADADADCSGAIDTQELKATLSKLGIELTDEQVDGVIANYDTDGSHELEEEEFMQLVSALIDGSAKLTTADDTRTTPEASAPAATDGVAPTPRVQEENERLRAENATLTSRIAELEAALEAATGAKPAPTRPPPAKPAQSKASAAAAAALRAGGAKPGNPGKEVKRKCPTCLHSWIDKYGKMECPKCLSPLPDFDGGSLAVRRAPGETAPVFQQSAMSAMESESGVCSKGGAHTWKFGKCSKCGKGEGAEAVERLTGGECPKGGRHVFKFAKCQKCGANELG